VLASVSFRNFKALRSAQLKLGACNLVLGPSGSGKTSLIEAVLRLRLLAAKAPKARPSAPARPRAPEIGFQFNPPRERVSVRLSCASDHACDQIEVEPTDSGEWPALREELMRIRSFRFDHEAIAAGSKAPGVELSANGGNLASVLSDLGAHHPEAFAAIEADFRRIMPEFSVLETGKGPDGRTRLSLRLAETRELIEAEDVAEGALYLLAFLALAFAPSPPPVVCMEEVDRGIHPRLLREVRDALYRLAYPDSFGHERPPVQVIATTHSPYLLDLFRDHPEEIVLSNKHGQAAHFERLSDRPDLQELLQEGSLGDMWYSGILGGVPDE